MTASTPYLRACVLILVPIFALSAQTQQTALVDGRLLRPSVDTFYMVSNVRGRADTTGRIVQSLVRRTVTGRSVWLQVYSFDGRSDYSMLDSLTMDSRTLLPITEARYNNMGNEHVAYTSRQVHTLVELSSGKRTVRDTSVRGPVYSSSTMDALARSLSPTVAGQARLAMFYPFPAPFTITSGEFTTIGTDTVAGRTGHPESCWVIKVILPEGFTRFWVSKSSHELLQMVEGDDASAVTIRR